MPYLASPTWRFPLGAVEAPVTRGTCGQRVAGEEGAMWRSLKEIDGV
jgi:hypothetical protein